MYSSSGHFKKIQDGRKFQEVSRYLLMNRSFGCSCDGHDLPWFLRIRHLAPGAVPHGFTFPENYPTDPVAGPVSWALVGCHVDCRCSWGLDCEEHLEQQPGWNCHEGWIDGSCGCFEFKDQFCLWRRGKKTLNFTIQNILQTLGLRLLWPLA